MLLTPALLCHKDTAQGPLVDLSLLRSKLRLQIRIDDFRKLLQEKNNTQNNEKVAYDTLQFYTYVTRQERKQD